MKFHKDTNEMLDSKSEPRKLGNKNYRKRTDVICPNVFEILQSLTLERALESFDMEGYEIMGDAFLNLIAALETFCFNGEKKYFYHAISNQNLFNLARAKKLESYIIGEEFQSRRNWLPPNAINKQLETQMLSDKSIADCVEALIGLYIIKCGEKSVRCLLKWLGFEISKEFEFKVDFQTPVKFANLSALDLNHFQMLEKKLN